MTKRSGVFALSLTALTGVGIVLSPVASSDGGAVGATCWSEPKLPSEGNPNWCKTVPRKFYPGVLMAVAKEATIKECRNANALDYGVHATPPGSCYKLCDTKTFCIYGVPND